MTSVSCVGSFVDVATLVPFDVTNASANAFSFDSASGKLVSNATMNTTVLHDYMTTASAFERFVILVGEKMQDKGMIRYLITNYAILTAVTLCMSVLARVLVIRSGVQTATGWALELGNSCCNSSLLRTHPCLLRILIWCTGFLVQTPHAAVIACSVHIVVLTGWAWAGLLCVSFGLGLTLTLTAFAVAFGGRCHCGPRQHKSIVLHLTLGLACILMAWVGQVSSLMKGFYTAAAMALTLSSIPLILAIYFMAGQHHSQHFVQIMGTQFLSHAWRKDLQHSPVNEARNAFSERNCIESGSKNIDDEEEKSEEREEEEEEEEGSDDQKDEDEILEYNSNDYVQTEARLPSVSPSVHASTTTSNRTSTKMSTFSAVSTLIHPYFDADTTINLVDNITNTISVDDGGITTHGNSSPGYPSMGNCAIQCARCSNIFYKCLCLCCFGNAGEKKKKRAARHRHAQRQQRGVTIWSLHMLSVDTNTVLYLVSAVIMLGYAIIVSRQAVPGWGGFGYYTGIMTLVLDLPALAAFRIGLVASPGISTMCLVANRCLILLANGGTVMLAETAGFVAYGMLFCCSNVDLRMGISSHFASRQHLQHVRQNGGLKSKLSHPLQSFIEKVGVWTFITPQEAVLGFLLFAYVGSYVSKGRGGALDIVSLTGCGGGRTVEIRGSQQISQEILNRPFFLICGVVAVPVVGFMRAACWMIHVNNNATQRNQQDQNYPSSMHPSLSSSSLDSLQSIATVPSDAAQMPPQRQRKHQSTTRTLGPAVTPVASEDEAWGKYLYGIFLAMFAEMLVVITLLVMQIVYPKNISIDVEITLIFVWPVFLCGRSGVQRWIWLDFPENDGAVWRYFGFVDALLIVYAIVGGLFGSTQLWCPLIACLTFEILGCVIPLVEMGGRAVTSVWNLSRFALAWGATAAIAHVAAHVLVITVVASPLMDQEAGIPAPIEGVANATTNITIQNTLTTTGSTTENMFTVFFWVVLLTGTFVLIPSALVLILITLRVLERGLLSSEDMDVKHRNPKHKTVAEVALMISMIWRSQFFVIVWMILLCVYSPMVGLWTFTVYVIVACASIKVASHVMPEGVVLQLFQPRAHAAVLSVPISRDRHSKISNCISTDCRFGSRARKLATVVIALVPLIPIAVSVVEETGNPGLGPDIYGHIVSAIVAINLMHWVWGGGLFAIISLLRHDVDVWCTPTIFPVYDWDPSLGEHGELIERNAGLVHAFAAIGEIILLCLTGVYFAKPHNFYVLVSTSNFVLVMSVALVMELTTRPILKYVEATEQLRNAMILMANQTAGGEDVGEEDTNYGKKEQDWDPSGVSGCSVSRKERREDAEEEGIDVVTGTSSLSVDGRAEKESVAELAAEGLVSSTLRWAWMSAAQVELRFQEHEQLTLVAHSHSNLRTLLDAQEGQRGAAQTSDQFTGQNCFVTTEGICYATREAMSFELRGGTGCRPSNVSGRQGSPPFKRRRPITIEGLLEGAGHSMPSVPPIGSAFVVKAEREKMMHLHSFRSVSQMPIPPKPSTFQSKEQQQTSIDWSGDSASHYLTADDTLVPLLAMVEADLQNCTVTVDGSHPIAIELVKRQLGGAPDVWVENAPKGFVASRLTKKTLFLDKYRLRVQMEERMSIQPESLPLLENPFSSTTQIIDDSAEQKHANVSCDSSKVHIKSVRTLYRAFGRPESSSARQNGEISWLLFVGDLSCTFDEWHQHSLVFLRNLGLLRSKRLEETESSKTSTENSNYERENASAVEFSEEDTSPDKADGTAIAKYAPLPDGHLPFTSKVGASGKVNVNRSSTVSGEIVLDESRDDQSDDDDKFTKPAYLSDVPLLERFFLTTAVCEMKHKMHTRLLVVQASRHFVKRAEALFQSFLDWCSLDENTAVLSRYRCEWLREPNIRLHRSGKKLHDPSATNTSPHVREICYGEVMRWSNLGESELRHMYERQRSVFALYCREKVLEDEKLHAASDRDMKMATEMELRREKAHVFRRAARFLWRDYPELLEEAANVIAAGEERDDNFGGDSPNIHAENKIDFGRIDTVTPGVGGARHRKTQVPTHGKLSERSVVHVRNGFQHSEGSYTTPLSTGTPSATFVDHSFQGSRAIFENPVDPTSTLNGKELADEISSVLAEFDAISSSSPRQSAFSAVQTKSSNRARSVSGLCSMGGDAAFDIRNLIKDEGARIVWARPHEFMKTPVLSDGFAADDIEQGLLGDCWLLSAMSAVAHSHGNILNKYTLGIRPPSECTPFDEKEGYQGRSSVRQVHMDGRYDIRIFVGGTWKVITIDDRIPCFVLPEGAPASQRRIRRRDTLEDLPTSRPRLRPVFGRSSTRNELWVSLLEKAIAKHYGSYEAITGGLVHVAMSLLTGGIGQMVRLSQAKKLGHVANGRLWLRMYNLHREGHLLAAGSPPRHKGGRRGDGPSDKGGGGRTGGGGGGSSGTMSPSSSAVSHMGIVRGHAYAILRIVQVRDMRGQHLLLQLRNPWGRPRGGVAWRGAWSDGDTKNWTQRMKSKVGYEAGSDGKFWMCFEDFVENFQNLYICRLYIRDLELPTSRPEKGWRRYRCPGSWTKTSNRMLGTAGGAPTRQNRYAYCNPQFLLQPTHSNTSVFITLEQPTLYRAQHVCIFVARVGGKRFARIRSRSLVVDSTPFSNSALVSCEIANLSDALRGGGEGVVDGVDGGGTNEDLRNSVDGTISALDGNGGRGDIAGRGRGNANAGEIANAGALTIMVCCYDEGAVGNFELAVYADYPLVAATHENCGEGMPGESLPLLGTRSPVEGRRQYRRRGKMSGSRSPTTSKTS